MAFEAQALATNEAAQRTVSMWDYGTSFRIKYFEVSAGGHDPNDPTTALTPDPAATSIPGLVLFGPEPIDGIIKETITCSKYACTIEQGEYTGELSSVGLIAEIVYQGAADPDPPAIGYQFLFAVYNRPRLNITPTDGPVTFLLTPFF